MKMQRIQFLAKPARVWASLGMLLVNGSECTLVMDIDSLAVGRLMVSGDTRPSSQAVTIDQKLQTARRVSSLNSGQHPPTLGSL
ncbi:hypothetical protein V1506DRAFT_544500 [Lipomyces tetrasporus]